jgi:hypothetical protein
LRRTSRTSKLGPIGKQFPFLWNLSGKLVHKALGGQVIRASEVQAAFWPEDRLRWPCAPESKIHSDVPRESVFIAADFPVPELREHPGMTPRSGRIGTSGPVEKPGSRRIPCIFPVDQRIGSRDEFAPDCLHRHSVCGRGDFRRAARVRPRKARDSAVFGRYALAHPNRRRRVSGLDDAAVGVCLCCQVGRFGFASDSP